MNEKYNKMTNMKMESINAHRKFIFKVWTQSSIQYFYWEIMKWNKYWSFVSKGEEKRFPGTSKKTMEIDSALPGTGSFAKGTF